MNSTVLVNKNTSRFKTAVVILSTIALVIEFLVFSINFIRSNVSIDSINIGWLTNLFSNTLTIAQYVYLIIYAVAFHNKPKANMFLMILFILLSFKYFYGIISEFLFSFVWYPVGALSSLYLFIRFAAVVLFAMAAVSAAKGFKTKSLVIAAVMNAFVIILLSFVINMFIASLYGHGMRSLIMITINLLGLFAAFLFNLALLFAGLGCSNDTEKPRELSTEEKLRILKQNLAQGTISFEEYTRQRSEIIGRL